MDHDILIIDDQPELALMMAQWLGDAGYSTRTVASASDALAAIGMQPPDLMLMDVNMPDIDGFALATMLKSDPATATIPIILVSAQDGRASKVIGLESGAEEYLEKPVDPVELLARIRNLLRLRDRAMLSAQG